MGQQAYNNKMEVGGARRLAEPQRLARRARPTGRPARRAGPTESGSLHRVASARWPRQARPSRLAATVRRGAASSGKIPLVFGITMGYNYPRLATKGVR